MENQLCLILVNKPEHKLKKPVGYHLDLSIVAILSGFSGLLGSPFLCAAPVRSLQHLQALSVYTKKTAPGEKPKLLRVNEQRVATIIVHVLIGEAHRHPLTSSFPPSLPSLPLLPPSLPPSLPLLPPSLSSLSSLPPSPPSSTSDSR